LLPPSSDASPPVSKLDAIPADKLKALRRAGLQMKDVIKLGRKGVCESLVAHIKRRWHTSEVGVG